MKKLNEKKSFILSAALIGAMTCMSGCGGSSNDSGPQTEMQIEMQTETQVQAQTEAVESTQEESSEPQLENTSEAAQTVQTETEGETETEETSQSEIKSDVETGTEEEEKSGQAKTVQNEAPVAEGSVAASDFAMIVRGVTVPLGSDLRDYTALLGEPDAYAAAKSCVEAGDDKVYTYGGVVIYTYITNGADIVSLIEVTGSEALPSGIHIGSTKADVIAVYGSAYVEEGTELLYEMGDKTIGLQMDGETVSFMELFGR